MSYYQGIRQYILEGHEPVVEPDLMTWARWFQAADRHIAQDYVGEVRISTVFLGLDHSFREGSAPVLFETMIFGGPFNDYQERCATWDEALKQHRVALRLARGGRPAWLLWRAWEEIEYRWARIIYRIRKEFTREKC